MPSVNGNGTSNESKDFLRPFKFHGLDFHEVAGSDEAIANCPFCGKERKFYVNKTNGKWSCKRCSQTGNVFGFLRTLYHQSFGANRLEQLTALSTERCLLSEETLITWGVVQSIITDDWLLPGYDGQNKIQTLYQYGYDQMEQRNQLHVTTGTAVRLFGMELWDNNKPVVYIAEGPWDAMALYEVAKHTKSVDGGYKLTNEHDNLYATANIVAVPSCNTFKPEWLPFMTGKQVVLLYDSDHPKPHPMTGQLGKPAGHAGMERTAKLLAQYEQPPASIHYLHWGDEGYDPSQPGGYDLRDHITSHQFLPERVAALGELLEKVKPIPEEWAPGRSQEDKDEGRPTIQPLHCDQWKTLTNEFRKAMKWTEGLDRGLSVMLASICSVPIAGDQLWVKMISPPSSGKSTLCEALGVAWKYVEQMSNIRGFHSGYMSDKQGTEDHSLINRVRNKTLVTKDGDTLLQAPNLGQILAEARDIYDRNSRSHYRHGKGRSYVDVNMTWILCGTPGLRSLDDGELGHRFLDCRIMEKIDEEQEDEINNRKLNQFRQLIGSEPNANGSGADGPEMLLAKQLTGGYIIYLRENVEELIKQVVMDDDAADQCRLYGKFVACLRARPSKRQDEEVQRELSTRLVMQFAKLAYCLAVVLNRKTVDEEVLRRVRQVALDTAKGRTVKLAHYLYQSKRKGCTLAGLASYTHETEDKCKSLLRFLGKIDVAEAYEPNPNNRVRQLLRWRLTERMEELYGRVIGEETEAE